MAVHNIVYRNLDVDETGVLVRAKAVTLKGYYVLNAAARIRYLKLYNNTAAPTVGSTTPTLTIPIPAASGANMYNHRGLVDFPKGLGVGATTAIADADTGAPSANDVSVNLILSGV